MTITVTRPSQVQQRCPDQMLTSDIQSARRLIHDENIRILDQGSGDAESLLLSTAEPASMLADLALVTFAEADHVLVEVSELRCPLDAFLRHVVCGRIGCCRPRFLRSGAPPGGRR